MRISWRVQAIWVSEKRLFKQRKLQGRSPKCSVCLGKVRRPIWQITSFYKEELRPREITLAYPKCINSLNFGCCDKMNKYSNAKMYMPYLCKLRYRCSRTARGFSSQQWLRNPGSSHIVSLPSATRGFQAHFECQFPVSDKKRLWRITNWRFILIKPGSGTPQFRSHSLAIV